MKFQGTGTALVTPFLKDGLIDEKALRKLVNFQIDNGTNMLIVLGSTGEAATLSVTEKRRIIDVVIEENKGRALIVVGMSDNNTAALVEELKTFNYKGVDAILSASPHYNKPSQRGIIAHFESISAVCQRPIILYNVPGRTASNILPQTAITLAKNNANIVGIKEASGNMMQVMQLLKDRPTDFTVLSGEDALTLPMVALGGNGVVSVVANALPKEFSTMISAALNGNLEQAKELHYKMLDITDSFFAEGNPSGIKYCLQLLGICDDTVRLPLTTITESLKEKMKQQLEIVKG